MDGHEGVFSAPPDSSTKKRKISNKKLHRRAISDQTEAPFGKDDHLKQSLSNSIDPLETLYSPSEVVSSSETMSLLDPSTLWNLPTPNESVGYSVLSTEWPNAQSIHESTNQCQYDLLFYLPEELNEDSFQNARA